MKIIDTAGALQEWRKSLSKEKTVGLVPTMGALHLGHASLLETSARENDFTIATIFVNPTQFNQTSDFEKYPKTWEADLAMCEKYGADVIFAPKTAEELYPDHFHYRVSEHQFSNELCGEFRPGHFEGVLTVVLKLLNLAKADCAYFGEKDHQQLTLLSGMAKAFFLETKIVPCPTVRESSGLAMSSRNLRLNPAEKEIAPRLFHVISTIQDLIQAKEELVRLGFRVEYLVDRIENNHRRRYVAAWLGDVRLIDNVEL
ncbi:MAG: pantoate--beta-alanine ligase [Bdellovibrionales bacterium]|nr:pantoate--beta-alanine ligase [Bdellovibrionales bacterium]